MRKRSLLLAAAAALAMPLAAPATAQDLDEVLARHFEAIGGLEAWEAVNSMRISGTMTLAAMGMEAPITIMGKRPGKSRLEFEIQGMTGIQAFDGEKGWQLMPFAGQTEPEETPESLTKTMREQADFDGPFIGWEEDGHQLELLGKEDVEGTETFKLKLTTNEGTVSYYYLDAEHYLPIMTVGEQDTQGTGVMTEVTTVFGDYKEVGGLMLAHSVEIDSMGGQTIVFDTIEINVELDDSLFSMSDN